MNLNLIRTINFTTVTIAQNSTMVTPGFRFFPCTGYASVKLTTSAGSVTITQQCSPDNILFYDPVDKSGTALGGVVTAMAVNTAGRYIQYDPVLSMWARFKIVELNVAATTVGISIYAQEGT